MAMRARCRSPSRFSKRFGRYVLTGEGATKQLKGVSPPLIRLRAQNHRIFFRDHGDYFKIETCARSQGGLPLMGYEAKKTEHCGPKRSNGTYWGYRRDAKKESIASAAQMPNARSATNSTCDAPNKHRTPTETNTGQKLDKDLMNA
jgi:hypothetical protein